MGHNPDLTDPNMQKLYYMAPIENAASIALNGIYSYNRIHSTEADIATRGGAPEQVDPGKPGEGETGWVIRPSYPGNGLTGRKLRPQVGNHGL